jgi:hypothetical protein
VARPVGRLPIKGLAQGIEAMKRHLVILATVVALALPARVGAEAKKAVSFDGTAAPAGHGWVDASELTNLLAEKELLTHQEQKELA